MDHDNRISRVTREQIQTARTADLFGYLESCHPALFKRTGHSLYMKEKDSVYIKDGIPGYMDFASGRHGNSIDFLIEHLHYGFVEAVLALSDAPSFGPAAAQWPRCRTGPRYFTPPPCASKPFTTLHKYLQGRGIPPWIISRMEDEGILYQEHSHGNAVFITPQKDYCEIRGTYGGSQNHFHSCRKAAADRFWYVTSSDFPPKMAFICESAIDAVSLLLLRKEAGDTEPSVFISIGGVCNQKAIDRIKQRMPAVIAVDNDAAGEQCRCRNSDIFSLIPSGKDWNEDLLNGVVDAAFH